MRGQVLKGPTADCLRWAGRTLDSDGIVEHYEGLIDALVADQRAEHVPTLETDVELDDPDARRRVAREVLDVRRRASVTRRMRTVAILPVKTLRPRQAAADRRVRRPAGAGRRDGRRRAGRARARRRSSTR